MQPDDKDQQQRNPSENKYNESFNPMGNKSGGKSGELVNQVAGKAAHAVKKKAIEGAVALTGVGAAVAKPAGAVLDKIITAKNAKRTAQAGIGGILVILLMSGVMNSPQQIFSHTKETTTDWSDKSSRDSGHLRTARILRWRYFDAFKDSSDCDVNESIRCRLRAGATEIEMQRMKREGLIKDGDYKQIDKRYTILRVRYVDKDGKEQVISSPKEFVEKYPITADLVARFQRAIIDPKAILFRSPQGIHVLFKFDVIRNNPIGNSSKLENIVDDFRRTMAADGASLEPVGLKDDQGNPIAANDSRAREIKQAMIEGVKGTDTQDSKKYDQALKKATNDFDNLITGCTNESLMQQLSVLGKLVKAPALIKYNASVQALIDQDRDSKLKNWEQSSMAANMLSKAGIYGVSKTKIYSDSGGYTLITQGKIRDDALPGMSKYANGIMLPGLVYGQPGCYKSDSPNSFLVDTQRSGGIYGSASGIDAIEWLTPQILMYARGEIVPDPEDDIEGGYNAGNAFASGASALASRLGRGTGDRPMSKQEFDIIDQQAPESSHIISDRSQTPLPPVASIGLFQLVSAIRHQDFSQIVVGIGNIYRSTIDTIAGFISPPVTAKEKYVDKYRGDLCTDYDVKVELAMWPKWSCDPYYGQLPSETNGDELDPWNVLSMMIGGGFIYASSETIVEEVYYGNLDELLAACREAGITVPTDCIKPTRAPFKPFSGGPKVFNNNFCDDLSLKSPNNVTDYPEPICNRPGPHSYDFVDGGNRLAKYTNGPLFLEWYATCIIWNHPIISQEKYLYPKYLPGDGTRIYWVRQCTDTKDKINEKMHRLFQFYVKDHNIEDSLENVGTQTLGDDTCSDPIYPNPNKFCALDSGTRINSMATGGITKPSDNASGAGDGSGGGGGSVPKPNANSYVDSNIQCASGTTDAGTVTTKYTGSLVSSPRPTIRLCKLGSIAGATVNAAVSSNFQQMGEAAKAAGRALSATSSFRLNDSCGGTGTGSNCASPGQSPHQLGVAIDFALTDGRTGSSTTSCAARTTSNDPRWIWLRDNAASYGIKQYTYENWHWDTTGMSNRC